MNTDLKTEWIAALRSEHYSQGRNCLKSRSGYCCLGVLAHIVNEKFPELVPEGQKIQEFGDTIDVFWDDWTRTDAMDNFFNKLGLCHSTQNSLVLMNDTRKNTFREIAKYIDQNV